MSVAFKCDRCKKYFEKYNDSYAKYFVSNSKAAGRFSDLCKECSIELTEFMEKYLNEGSFIFNVYRRVLQGQDGNEGVETDFVDSFATEEEANEFVKSRTDTNGWVSYVVIKEEWT